jgi:two-component sensor histidine kinase
VGDPQVGESGRDRTIERLLRQQAVLAEFGMFAFREHDLQSILTEAARVCAESLGVPFCKVCRYRPDEDDLLIEAGVGWASGVVGRVISRADESSPQGRAYVTRRPVLIRNLHELNDIALPAFYREHGIVSTIDVVIQGRDGVPYGVLEIDSPFEHVYDQHDINFLTGFTNVLAEAVATAERTEKLRQTLATQEALLAEKNTLAQELQHRVRNNLHMVHAMLGNEIAQTDDGLRSDGIAAIARRVMTMAQVYDHLLGTGMSRTIDFAAYVESLCRALPDTQSAVQREVALVCDADPLTLDLDLVTALGMVVAELVANSYKHAFPGHRGTIRVALRHVADSREATLTICDDGVGFPVVARSKRHGVGLAMRLMEQIAGTIVPKHARGTSWELRFPVVASSLNAVG